MLLFVSFFFLKSGWRRARALWKQNPYRSQLQNLNECKMLLFVSFSYCWRRARARSENKTLYKSQLQNLSLFQMLLFVSVFNFISNAVVCFGARTDSSAQDARALWKQTPYMSQLYNLNWFQMMSDARAREETNVFIKHKEMYPLKTARDISTQTKIQRCHRRVAQERSVNEMCTRNCTLGNAAR